MGGVKDNLYLAAQSSLFWTVFLIAYLVLGIFSACHALLNKRDPRSALGWVVACLSLPIAGSLAYLLFGINRIASKAKSLTESINEQAQIASGELAQQVPGHLSSVGARITQKKLTHNNQWECLRNGEAAFPAMMAAIDAAVHQVVLSTYIFANDVIGQQFTKALKSAHGRGVSVYVLIDGIGARYSLPSMVNTLQKNGIRCAQFLPPKWLPPQFSINLRNHRKILVVDQLVAFTGGINISEKHMVTTHQKAAADLHFKFTGDVVEQLSELFWHDWQLATGEFSKMLSSKPENLHSGGSCRLIADGPDGDLDQLSLVLNAAIAAAKDRVTILTPYFIPSREMVAAMLSAVHRGVSVELLLPERSNLRYVDWASEHMRWQLLKWDVAIYLKPPPFEHSKLVLIDDAYAMVGSANIDPRSLRLNFELMVEIFDHSFNQSMTALCDGIIKQSRQQSLNDVQNRPLWQKLRDGFFWLFSPYL